MKYLFNGCRRALSVLLLVCSVSLTSGCATVAVHTEGFPPILAPDELLRPYDRVGAIEVNRDRYGSSYDLTPADYSWAYQALREEAARIGADAVIYPEVTVEMETYIFFPSSHMSAKGIAIKFR